MDSNNEALTGDKLPHSLDGLVDAPKESTPGKDLKNGLTYSGISSALAGVIMVVLARNVVPPFDSTEYAILMAGLTVILNGGLIMLKKLMDRI